MRDSYVTLEQADQYIALRYAGDPVERVWAGLDEAGREALLADARGQLDALPFTGRRTDPAQPMAFPRWPGVVVPEAIQAAQVETALLPLRASAQRALDDAGQRAMLQRQGVVAFSLGDLSESYSGAGGLAADSPILADARIWQLVARYLSGGYAVC